MYCFRSCWFNLKEYIKEFLIKKNISIIDLGPNNESVDYPDYAKKVAIELNQKKVIWYT